MTNILRSTLCAVLVLAFAAAVPAVAADGVVNINTASIDELSLLPRVGAVVAQRIIDFREDNGSFGSPEDLLLVSGIGDKTFALLAPHVAVDGETTMAEKVRTPRPAEKE